MKTLHVCDLDKTLINETLEKSFIFHLWRKKSLRKIIVRNILCHICKKLFSHFNHKYNLNYFLFWGINLSLFNKEVSLWLKTESVKKIKINNDLLNLIKKDHAALILTNSPLPISKPFIENVLTKKFKAIFGTKIEATKSCWSNKLKMRMHGIQKAKVVKKLLYSDNIYMIGYGDSLADKYFMDLCHESQMINF